MSSIKYPIQSDSLKQRQDWAKSLGFLTTYEGLILPKGDSSNKICENLEEVSKRIKEAQDKSKHVLYLPGTYDLVHIGHLSFILQAIEFLGKKRENLFVVALADSDNLISLAKAHKHISKGGKEEFERPIEKGSIDNPKKHPRLMALSALPVDCVGFLPGPKDPNLPKPYPLDKNLAIKVTGGLNISPQAQEKIVKAVNDYPNLFEKTWFIELWQLYLTLFLSQKQYDGKDLNITRIVSKSDSLYFDQVKALSLICSIKAEIIDDVIATSTTGLVEEFGAIYLLESKKRESFEEV